MQQSVSKQIRYDHNIIICILQMQFLNQKKVLQRNGKKWKITKKFWFSIQNIFNTVWKDKLPMIKCANVAYLGNISSVDASIIPTIVGCTLKTFFTQNKSIRVCYFVFYKTTFFIVFIFLFENSNWNLFIFIFCS
jgi:hypothetical protein